VFVPAITQVSQGLIQRLTWSGAFQALVLLLAVWWVWSYTAWTTDLYDPQQPAIQRLVIAAMFGTFVMAVALPDAFGRRGLVFAGVYVAIHIGRRLFLVRALRGHELQRRTARILFWFGGVRRALDRGGAPAQDGARGPVDTRGGRGLRGSHTPLPHAGPGPLLGLLSSAAVLARIGLIRSCQQVADLGFVGRRGLEPRTY
jgi:hypothetical protein